MYISLKIMMFISCFCKNLDMISLTQLLNLTGLDSAISTSTMVFISTIEFNFVHHFFSNLWKISKQSRSYRKKSSSVQATRAEIIMVCDLISINLEDLYINKR